MITIASISKDSPILNFIAYEKGVFFLPFQGDTEYIDDNSDVFYWAGVSNETPIVTGVRFGTIQYTETTSLSDCTDNPGTFFYDSPTLYIHHLNSAHDISLKSDSREAQKQSIFASYGYDRTAKAYYDKVYYHPGISDVSDLSISADPLKLGLISFGESTIALQNIDGEYDDVTDEDTTGNNIEIFAVPGGTDSTVNSTIVYEGIVDGGQKTEQEFVFNIREKRYFFDTPVCANVASVDDYPDIDTRYEGKALPVAFGDVRRAPLIPINSSGVTKNDSGTITFLLADTAYGELVDISTVKLYDDDDNELTISARSSANNTVSYSKGAGDTANFRNFSWEGKGYDIPGTYNNGLDIIKFAFVSIAGLSFIDGVFDIANWDAATLNNTKDIGIASNSSRGITTEIIEPITTSLQGYVLSDNTGALRFFNRDTDAEFSYIIEQDEILGSVNVDISTESLVSGVRVEYSPSFVDNDDILQAENVTYRQQVAEEYGVDRFEPISPIRTVLVNEPDAIDISKEILETSINPERDISVEIAYNGQVILPFEMIAVDIGRYNENDYKRIEVLSVSVDINRYVLRIEGRILGDADVLDNVTPHVYGDGIYLDSIYGG